MEVGTFLRGVRIHYFTICFVFWAVYLSCMTIRIPNLMQHFSCIIFLSVAKSPSDASQIICAFFLSFQTDSLMDELSVVPSNYRGEIIVALKFIPPPRQLQSSSYNSKQSIKRRSSQRGGVLMILVKEAKNLVSPKGSPDPFCKW